MNINLINYLENLTMRGLGEITYIFGQQLVEYFKLVIRTGLKKVNVYLYSCVVLYIRLVATIQ